MTVLSLSRLALAVVALVLAVVAWRMSAKAEASAKKLMADLNRLERRNKEDMP